jgi:hypothetical protein
MRIAAVIAVGCAMAFGCVGACSGGGAQPPTNDAAVDGGPTGTTCQDIRVCAGFAASDADVQKCIAMGTVAAQQGFQALHACRIATGTMAANCASDLDVSCICQEECFADGYCMAAAEACLGGATTDLFCNGPCTP